MNFKLLPVNARGTLDPNLVSPVTLTTTDRTLLPLPPGNVQVNGYSWPNGATYVGDVTLTWANRIRTAQVGRALVAEDAGSVAGTIEGSITVDVLIAGTVKRTQTGMTGTSFVYTHAQRVADDPDLSKPVQFRITPVNGSYSGTVRTTDSFLMQ